MRRAGATVILQSHLWFGAVTAVAVIVVSITGVYLNHRESLGLWTTPKSESSGGIADALSIRQLLIAGLTGAHDDGLDVSARTRAISRLLYRPGRGQAAIRFKDARSTEVVVDATTGAVLQVAPRDDVRIEHLHSGEVLGQRGVVLSDIAAVVLVALVAGGVVLWLNRLRRSWGRPQQASGRSAWLRWNRRLHLFGGLAVGAAVVLISVTGVLLNHKREFGYMVEPYHPQDYEPQRLEPLPLAVLAANGVTAAADRGMTSTEDVRWIDFRPGSSYVKVRFKDDRETEALINAYDGEVIGVASRRDVFLERLHSGAYFGAHWTLMSDIAAGVLVLLTLNGIYLWIWPSWTGRTRTAASADAAGVPERLEAQEPT